MARPSGYEPGRNTPKPKTEKGCLSMIALLITVGSAVAFLAPHLVHLA